MGSQARADATTPATRIHLEELAFFRLTSAHGEIFETDARYRVRIEALQAEAKQAVREKQKAFEAIMQALAVAHAFDASKVTQWDKDTLDLILNTDT